MVCSTIMRSYYLSYHEIKSICNALIRKCIEVYINPAHNNNDSFSYFFFTFSYLCIYSPLQIMECFLFFLIFFTMHYMLLLNTKGKYSCTIFETWCYCESKIQNRLDTCTCSIFSNKFKNC